jgi:DNA-binding XRE family transcriptional regulator
MADYRDRAAAGRWICEYRDKIGLTQDEFRAKWHINRTRLVEIEHGNLIPSVEEIERLKQAFALSFNDWLSRWT